MHVLVTAGGTREPVDDVRVLSNTSTGRLGAHLAELFADAGHDVLLLHGHGAVQPQGSARGTLERQLFGSAVDLGRLLQREAPRADVVLHAAAVSDYVPVRAPGKISSSRDELTLTLKRAPKLIDSLRELAPLALLVGFKLTSGCSREQRLTFSRWLLQRARLDLVVSNDVGAIDEHDHEVLLVGRSRVAAHGGGKAAVARAILAAVRAMPSGTATPR